MYHILLAFIINLTIVSADTVINKSDWKKYFEGTTGTIIIVDDREKDSRTYVFNKERSETSFHPASTYKLPHTLFALDSELIRDEKELISWNGVKRDYEPWNADQTLSSALRYSTVWVFEEFAEKIGKNNTKKYLKKIEYGNMKHSGRNPYWINGDLRISSAQQITFLKRLSEGNLPFQQKHQNTLKKAMILEQDNEKILRGKTGWNGEVGWFVGWMQNKKHPNRNKQLVSI